MKQLNILVPLFAANTISGFAQGITMLSIPWYILGIEGGKFALATMVMFITLASLFWGLYAGSLIDKYNRKHIFLTLNIVDACILGAIATFGMSQGSIGLGAIICVYTTTLFTYNIHYPNLYAFVQELFEPAYYAKVNSALEIQGQTTNFLGMMTGGLLLEGTLGMEWWPAAWRFEAWTLPEILMLDASTYAISFLLLSRIPYVRKASWRPDKGHIWARLRFGFRYLRQHMAILRFGIASYVVFFSLLVMVQVVAPVYVMDYLAEGAGVLALFKGFYAIGAISAGIIGMAYLVRQGNLIKQIIGLLLLAGALYVTLTLTHSVEITLGAAVLLGIANAGTRIQRITYLVRLVPNEVIGRVNAFFAVVNVLMRVAFLGLLAIPFFSAEENGTHIVYAIMFLALIMFLAAWVLWRRFDSFDQSAAVG